MELKIRNVDSTTVKKIDEKAKKPAQSWQQFWKNQVDPLAIFNQHSDQEGHLKNLTEANSKMTNRFAISMKILNDRLKELMRKYRDDE